MDYKFLNKVVDQIVSETEIDYERGRVNVPFHYIHISPIFQFSYLMNAAHYLNSFYIHCKDIYGLNKEEMRYVLWEYRNIIIDKING